MKLLSFYLLDNIFKNAQAVVHRVEEDVPGLPPLDSLTISHSDEVSWNRSFVWFEVAISCVLFLP